MFDKFWGRGEKLVTRDSVVYLFKVFTYLGINPPSKYRIPYYIYSALINITVLFYMPFAFNMSYFLDSKNMDTSRLLTSLQAAINVFGLPVKLITIALSLNRLRSAEKIMDFLDESCTTPEEMEKIHKTAMMGNRFVVIFCISYGSYTTSNCLCSMAMGQPPYMIYMPFLDWRASRLEFILQSLIEFIFINAVCLHQVVDDVYAVIYIYILRMHMQMLVKRVERLGTDSAKSKDENNAELVRCIVDHKNLLDLQDIVSPVISVTIFVQFVITAALLGTTMINIFIFADRSAQIASVAYISAVLVQTSPCCYQATCLIEDCEKLPVAIFHCNWVHEDQRFRKMLIFFMQRAQRTMTLTAMKLFPITLNTNVSIAKFSFTLYTLIKEMDFGQNLKN